MMSLVRRTLVLTAIAALVAIPSSLPALAQSGTVTSVAHRQSVLTELSPTGEVDTSRIITQLTVEGDGQVEVALPAQSTNGLRNLEGFGGPRVDGDTVHWDVDATPEGTHRRSVADHTGDHPIMIGVSYALDGEAIDPEDLVGRSGTVTVTLDIENVTAEQRDVVVYDGQGRPTTEEMTVAVPIVGSVTATLDGRFLVSDAPGAKIVGDGRGNTVVDWLLVMFSPIGSEQQTVSYTADVTDAVVAPVTATFVPVHAGSFPSLRNSQDAYAAAKNGLSDLTNGALIVDGNVKLLGSGAAQLLDGLVQLRDGAEQLNDGLAGTAAPGARTLSEGMSRARSGGRELADGLGDLRNGASRLSDGLSSARSGGGRLASGLRDLDSGATRLSDGLSQAAGGALRLDAGLGALADGGQRLLAGLQQLRAAVLSDEALPAAAAGAQLIAGTLTQVLAGIGSPTTPDTLLNGLARIEGGLSNPACSLADPQNPSNPCGVLQVLGLLRTGIGDATTAGTLLHGVARLRGGISNPACVLTNPTDPANPCGIRQGATIIQAGASDLSDAVADIRGTLLDIDGSPLSPTDQARLEGSIAGLGEPATPGTVANGLAQIGGGAGNLIGGADQLLAGIGDASTANTLLNGIAQIDGGLAALQAAIGDPATPNTLRNGVARISGGLSNPACDVANPTNPSNPCGVREILQLLQEGATDLAGGLNAAIAGLDAGLGTPTTPDTLINGASQIAAGAQQASDGATDLSGGLVQLDDGAGQLAAGAGTAASGARDLSSGLVQLDDGAGQLASGAGRAASGANDLANGLVQLDDGAGLLANGLVDAADGSGRIAEGLGEAADGGERIADGTVALSEQGMGAIIDGATAGAAGPSRLLEQANAANTRGRIGDGLPYGTVSGADASAVFRYDIATVGITADEGPSTALRAGAAVLAFALAGGLAFALRRRLFV